MLKITLKNTLKNALIFGCAGGVLTVSGGCSSIMTHTGANQGYYPGTRASMQMLRDEDTSWSMMPLAALDLPFSAVLDTVLLPYDYMRKDSDKGLESPHERMLHPASRPAAAAK